jgi:hypothetical protein
MRPKQVVGLLLVLLGGGLLFPALMGNDWFVRDDGEVRFGLVEEENCTYGDCETRPIRTPKEYELWVSIGKAAYYAGIVAAALSLLAGLLGFARVPLTRPLSPRAMAGASLATAFAAGLLFVLSSPLVDAFGIGGSTYVFFVGTVAGITGVILMPTARRQLDPDVPVL